MYRQSLRSPLKVGAAVAATVLVAVALQGAMAEVAHATSTIPYQFISKTYTEGLGRIPDQSGWTTEVNYFSANGCDASTVASQANRVLTSSEFTGLGYSNAALVEVAYRTLMNREPDAGGFNSWLGNLNGGMTWPTLLSNFEGFSEFTTMAATICSTTEQGFGTYPAISLSPSGTGFSGTEATLQTALNAAGSGGTVYLQSRTVVPLTGTLTIPAGVTLATTGLPSVQKYAEMGRLSRSPGWSGESVHISAGATLTHVWVDGDRTRETGTYDNNRYNIRLYGGTNTKISSSRIGNTSGATNIETEGVDQGYTCTSAYITDNLIDAYTTHHANGDWSDGISNACENATITGNGIVDASDVSIILFGQSTAQNSHVNNNTIVQAGHGAFGLLGSDPSTGRPGSATLTFTNAQITNNLIWTAPTAPSTFGITDGTYGWFGPSYDKGSGTTITGNTSGSLSVYAETGIVVSGMLSTTVTGNTLNYVATTDSQSSCPKHAVGASVTAGYASGTIQAYTDDTYSQCVGH